MDKINLAAARPTPAPGVRARGLAFFRSDAGWLLVVFGLWRGGLALWAGWSSPPVVIPAEELLPRFGYVYGTYREAQPATGPAAAFWLDPWYRWDAGWYLGLSLGYTAEGTQAFAPLYPLLIGLATPLAGGNALGAGLLISGLSALAALRLLMLHVQPVYGQAAARRAAALLMLFPTGLFLASVYSEALYLACVLGALAAARAGRWGWAAVLVTLTVLTRYAGVMLIVPLGWLALEQWRHRQSGRWQALGAALAAPITLGAYWWLAGVGGAQALSDSRFDQALSWPWDSLSLIVEKLIDGPMWIMDWVNLGLLGVVCVTAAAMPGRLPAAHWLYAWASLAVLMCVTINGTLLLFGLTRYVLVVFPLFALWARALEGRRWLKPLVVIGSAAGQMIMVWLYTRWIFVG